MACKVILNADSGNYSRLDLNKLLQNLGCVDTEVETITSEKEWSAEGYDTLIVCGGDGTLHNALDKCVGKKIVYVPCGTLNETAHTDNPITSVGKVNNDMFSYVCAAGSFTEIGYSAKNNRKKKWKAVAYLPQVLANYRCHEISAQLNFDGRAVDGEFTLLMVLKSHRCFGFSFNKSYKKHKGLYLVAIRSRGRDTLKNRIKIFAPFFRVFFLGVKKPQINRNWLLVPFENLTVKLKKPQSFCLDGERRVLSDELRFSAQTLDQEIRIVKPPFMRRKTSEEYPTARKVISVILP